MGEEWRTTSKDRGISGLFIQNVVREDWENKEGKRRLTEQWSTYPLMRRISREQQTKTCSNTKLTSNFKTNFNGSTTEIDK